MAFGSPKRLASAAAGRTRTPHARGRGNHVVPRSLATFTVPGRHADGGAAGAGMFERPRQLDGRCGTSGDALGALSRLKLSGLVLIGGRLIRGNVLWLSGVPALLPRTAGCSGGRKWGGGKGMSATCKLNLERWPRRHCTQTHCRGKTLTARGVECAGGSLSRKWTRRRDPPATGTPESSFVTVTTGVVARDKALLSSPRYCCEAS